MIAERRFWEIEGDELDRAISEATGERPPRGTEWELDPSLAATVRAVASLYRGPEPEPAFAERLARQFGLPAVTPAPARSRPRRVPPPKAPVRHPGWRIPSVPVRRFASQFSLLLLVLVMIGGMWLTIDRDGHRGSGESTDLTAIASGPFPAMAGGHTFMVRRIMLDPHTRFDDFRHGPAFFVVERGTIHFRSLADQTDRTLTTGQMGASSALSAIILDNDGQDPATVLDAGTYPLGSLYQPLYVNSGVTLVDVTSSPIGIILPPDATVTFHLATLATGAPAEQWTMISEGILVVESGHLALTLTGEHLPYPFESGIERTRSAGRSTALLPGVTVVARNPAGEPLVFLLLTVDPAPLGTPTG